MRQLKQSTAATLRVFMTDATDRTAGIAGLTLTVTACKAGESSHTSLTPTSQQSVGNGWYDIVLSTTHTNTLGVMTFHITGTGADPTDIAVEIVSQLIGELATPTNITAGTITTATNVTTVNGLAANVITAASVAADAVAEIADAVWDEATAGHVGAGTTGLALTDILADTAEIGTAGAGLTNINLPDQTMNITGNLSGSVGSVTALGTTAKSDVNAEVVDVLATDTHAEVGQGTPPATASYKQMLQYLYKNWRNKKTETATTFSLYADDGTTVDQKATVSDDTTTATKGEIATGP